jgi:hypothetical protein
MLRTAGRSAARLQYFAAQCSTLQHVAVNHCSTGQASLVQCVAAPYSMHVSRQFGGCGRSSAGEGQWQHSTTSTNCRGVAAARCQSGNRRHGPMCVCQLLLLHTLHLPGPAHAANARCSLWHAHSCPVLANGCSLYADTKPWMLIRMARTWLPQPV